MGKGEVGSVETEIGAKNRWILKKAIYLPMLLIATTSVLGNWKKEIERFAPHLKAVIHHGIYRINDKDEFQKKCLEHDNIITSFSLARKDEKLFQTLNWHRIVVDEAQNIKNPKAAQTRAILKLKANYRAALN